MRFDQGLVEHLDTTCDGTGAAALAVIRAAIRAAILADAPAIDLAYRCLCTKGSRQEGFVSRVGIKE